MAGTLRLKSNGESKIVIFKAALCYGFAITLRALFLGILCPLIASLTLAMTKNSACKNIYRHCSEQRASEAIERVGCSRRLLATRLAPLAMTQGRIAADVRNDDRRFYDGLLARYWASKGGQAQYAQANYNANKSLNTWKGVDSSLLWSPQSSLIFAHFLGLSLRAMLRSNFAMRTGIPSLLRRLCPIG